MFRVGAGNSTCYFPRYLDDGAIWITVEHDKEWFEKIKKKVNTTNTKIYLVPPNNFPFTDTHSDGSYLDLKDYIEFPKTLGIKFDFILIDGRARKHCLISALDILKRSGVVVLHDANRKYYHKTFRLYNHQVLFEDKHCNIWISSKTLDSSTIRILSETEK